MNDTVSILKDATTNKNILYTLQFTTTNSGPGLFSVQFYTNYAVLNETVEFYQVNNCSVVAEKSVVFQHS